MKAKKVVIYLLMLTFLIQCAPCVIASNTSSEEILVIDDAVRNETIDALFAARMNLEHDYEGNSEEIYRIDQQLLQLGVEMLSTNEAMSLLGGDNLMPL